MATITFREPGTDVTQNLNNFPNTYFGGSATGASATDQFKTGLRSLKCVTTGSGDTSIASTADGVCADAGTRFSVWVRVLGYPASHTHTILATYQAAFNNGTFLFAITTGGKIQLYRDNNFSVGAAGATTVATGTWTRISGSWVITSGTNWTCKVYINGVLELTRTQADGTIINTGSSELAAAVNHAEALEASEAMTVWFDDFVVDDGTDLADIGNIYIPYVDIPVGSAPFTGYAPSVQVSSAVSIAIPAGSVPFTGYASTATVFGVIAIPAGSVPFTGYAPTPTIATPDVSIAVGAGSVPFTGYAPTSTIGGTAVNISIGAGSVPFTGQYVGIQFGGEITVGSVPFTGYAPTVQISGQLTIAIPVGSQVFTGYAPSLTIGGAFSIAIPAGSVPFTGYQVLPNGAFLLDIPAGSVPFTGNAPSIDWGTGIPVGSVVFSGAAPQSSVGFNMAIPAGAVAWTGYAPSLDAPHVIAIPAGSQVWTGRVTTVLNGGRLPQGDLTTQVAIWIRTLPAGSHLNTRMRDTIATLYGLNPNITDVTPAFARFTRDRN